MTNNTASNIDTKVLTSTDNNTIQYQHSYQKESDRFLCHFARHTCSDVKPREILITNNQSLHSNVYTVSKDTLTTMVLQSLIKEGYSSCLVEDNTTHMCLGIIHLHDIVRILFTKVYNYHTTVSHNIHTNLHIPSLLLHSDTAIAHRQLYDNKQHTTKHYLPLTSFLHCTVEDALRKQYNEQPIYNMLTYQSLFSGLEILSQINQHSIPILNEQTNELESILTTSMIISLLDCEIDEYSCIADITINALLSLFLTRHVEAIRSVDRAMLGFKVMLQHNINALAVLDKHSHLYDVLSIRDIRGIGFKLEHIHMLNSNVEEYKWHCAELYRMYISVV